MVLKDRVAIVTGSGRGIGRRIAQRFVREGAAVVVAEIRADDGERTCGDLVAEGGRARFVETDVTSQESIERMVASTVEEFGGVDVLINNASATGHRGDFLDVDRATWERILAATQTSVFLCSQAVAREMAAHGRGSIVNISSVNGLTPQPRNWAYGSAKGGALTLNLISGVGMLGAGVIGSQLLGNIQDREVNRELLDAKSELHAQVVAEEEKRSVFGDYYPLDDKKLEDASPEDKKLVAEIRLRAKKTTLTTNAVFPGIMLVAYVLLILWFRSRGGYRPVELKGSGDT